MGDEKLIGIFDTHAHYDDDAFDKDRDELLKSMFESGVVSNVIDCGCDLNSSLLSLKLSEKYDEIYSAIGIHPENITESSLIELDALKELYENKKVVAVGEIGLDYHWMTEPKDKQIQILESQLRLSKELDLPVIVHDRGAHNDTMELLLKYKPKGVMHCFSGSVEMAQKIVEIGMYVGFGGAITFKNVKKPLKVVESVPLERILLETDCPYMSPEPHRGMRNDSTQIVFVAKKIAEVKGMLSLHSPSPYSSFSPMAQEIINITNQNARNLFKI